MGWVGKWVGKRVGVEQALGKGSDGRSSVGMDGIGKGADEGADLGSEGGIGAELGDPVDDGGADDDGVGVGGHFAGLIGIGDAEADGDGQLGMLTDAAGHVADGSADGGLHAGDTFAGDVVDEALGAAGDPFDAGIRGGGSDEPDGAHAGLPHECLIVIGFLRGQIEDEESIDTGGGGLGDEVVETDAMEEVEIDVEDDGDLGVASDVGDGLEDFGRGGAGGEATLGGELVDDAIGEWIAEGDTEFEDIDSGVIEFEGELAGGFEVGIAGANVDDETLAVLGAETGEA